MSLDKKDYYHSVFPHEFRQDREQFIKLISRRINQCKKTFSEDNIIKLCNCLIFGRNLFTKESLLEYIHETTQLKFSKDMLYIIYVIYVSRETQGIIVDRMKFATYEFIYRDGLLRYKPQQFINNVVEKYT